MSGRTPELSVLAVLAGVVAAVLLLGGSDRSGADAVAGFSPERIAQVERRVERLRGLRFRRPVRVEVLTPEEARAFGERQLERQTSARERAAYEELMKLLGLIEPDVDMDALNAAILGEHVAGFYDPRRERLVLVDGVGVDEATLAHELTHALEDQHFGLDRIVDGRRGDDDGQVARSALIEGTAMVVMLRYLERHPDALSLGDALGQVSGALGASPLPPYVMRSLLFPYQRGERFVTALRRRGRGWRLVDAALAGRPPVASADLYEPRRWVRGVRPAPVALPPARALGPRWSRVTSSTLGRFDLRELLTVAVGEPAAETLAAGWAGGRYALWRRGPAPAPGCASPCLRRSALVVELRFASPASARAVRSALGAWLRTVHRAVPVDGAMRRWRIVGAIAGRPSASGTVATVTTRGRRLRLVLAPTAAAARRLAR